ncbi:MULTISPECIES: bactofilin family protein [Sulfurimonas]|uniref:Polymer-forming cytoskeletal protein n=1 Tax=Sulfurimonas marina TaxID=2590551 RepID=A0A7M1AWT3_9BACT|nr:MULTISPECIES: polymer-forming cytoskeletal protein [Sulfurimonas]QOP41776.1 polymer-forming cytoskeletal protein [Sulfurimonas marina]
MAIFNNSDVPDNISTDSNTTIITTGAKIKGELELSCNLYIDGILEGNINSTKEVNVGKNGHIKGEIVTERLVVQGFVEGTIDAQRVEIKAAGHVSGEIKSSELVIEAKGIFEGNSIIKNDATI